MTGRPVNIAVLFAVALVALVVVPSSAFSCIYRGNTHFEVMDNDAEDGEAPTKVDIEVVDIQRGTGFSGPFSPGGSRGSCSDLGVLRVALDSVEDDVGYRFEVIEGSFEGYTREEPVRPPGCSPEASSCDESEFQFSWVDGATDHQEPLDFRLRVTPVDRAGREGPSSTVQVSDRVDGGGGCGGCGQAGGAPLSGGAAVVFGVLLAGMRRRRR